MKRLINNILGFFITILTPIFIILTMLRLMLTPLFLDVEYNMPAFPPDPYGFTKQERLHWSKIALNYLINDQGIAYLGDLKFEDGNPVYNQRELKHMVDVKQVVQKALVAWYILLGLFLLIAILAWKTNNMAFFRSYLAKGGLLTIIFIAFILVFVLVGFGIFFVAFHNLFFEPGTWTFLWSDTLIRLFPERFWKDTFMIIGGLSIFAGWGLWVWGKKLN
ncbi:MAG: TIGR01906 family membrane protein [Anaerolineales bacterium]